MDLRMHVEEIHFEFYDIDETELFFRMLELNTIEEIRKLEPFTKEAVVEVIKKRFNIARREP
jgi:hypothetical protein